MVPSGLRRADDEARHAEVESARQVMRELARTSRAARTYGLRNPTTERFLAQLDEGLKHHLEEFGILGVVVDHAELRLYDEAVYRSEDSVGESLAFRLYSDGIREFSFLDGVNADDLRDVVDAVWGEAVEDDDDDDIVTRLWAKELQTISFVTAEELMEEVVTDHVEAQAAGFFAPAPESFKGVLEQEIAAASQPTRKNDASVITAGTNLHKQRTVLGFDVDDGEQAALDVELADEVAADSVSYVVEVVKAILKYERSSELLLRTMSVMPRVIESLLRMGRWGMVEDMLSTMQAAPEVNESFEHLHVGMARQVEASLGTPFMLRLVGVGLNGGPERPAAELAVLLKRLRPTAVRALIDVLGHVTSADHRAVVRDSLVELGRGNPHFVLDGLMARPPRLLRDLLSVVVAWNDASTAQHLVPLATHDDEDVRKDACIAVAWLQSRGDARLLLAFANDESLPLRMRVLRQLANGSYAASLADWEGYLEPTVFAGRSANEKRLAMRALVATADEAAIPFLSGLLGEGGWVDRKQKLEAALMAVDALAELGTPAAKSVLEEARRTRKGALQEACDATLRKLAGGGK